MADDWGTFKEEREKIWQALFSIAEATGMDTGDEESADDHRGDQEFFLTSISHHIAAGLRAWNGAHSRVGTDDERDGDEDLAWKPPIEVVAESMLFGVPRKSRTAKAGK